MLRNKIHTIISFPVFIILYTHTAITVLFILLFSYIKWKRAVYAVMGTWAKMVFVIMGKRLHITGRKHLDKSRNYILLANHSSMFDITAIMTFYPGVSWFGHERLLKIPLVRKMLLMTDYIPMTLKNVKNTRLMLQQLVEKSRGRTIAIFPEGTRTLDGKISPFYRGFVYLLRASEADILPVTLNGFYKLKPKNRFYINFSSKLEIVIHKPIPGPGLIQLEDKEIIERVKGVIESASIG